ncbi:MAG TPA: glycosyltransferase family 4 protein [Verrucomicrobiae bacterium]
MRIAHVLRKYNPAEWGGTETALQRLFNSLRHQHIDSVVYCPKIETGQLPDPFKECGCEVKRFNACVPVWGISRQRRCQLVSVGGNLMSFDLLGSLWQDRDLALVHAHTMGRIGAIGNLVAKRRKIPFVITVHGGLLDLPPQLKASFENPQSDGVEWGKAFGFFLRTRHLVDEADAIVTCNPREAELLKAKHPKQRIITQPHGVVAEAYRVNHRDAALMAFPQIHCKEILLCVGRVDPVKNQGWLTQQAPEFLKRHPGAVLVFLGSCTDAAYGEQIDRDIKQLGLQDRVFMFGGFQPQDPRLIGLLQLAQVVLVPSVSETFGIVILEAWAAGAPVIASRTSGALSLMKDHENGWLFDLQKPEEFHAALDEAMLKPDLAAEYAAKGGQLVDEKYDAGVLALGMKRFYETLIEEKHALRDSSR